MKTTHEQLTRGLFKTAIGWMFVLIMGCATSNPTMHPPRATAPQPTRAQTQPETAHFGPGPAKVVSVNPELRFVVIDFSSRVMPPIGARLSVFRGEKNVGTVQITEPVRARLATADILDGEVRVGDEAR